MRGNHLGLSDSTTRTHSAGIDHIHIHIHIQQSFRTTDWKDVHQLVLGIVQTSAPPLLILGHSITLVECLFLGATAKRQPANHYWVSNCAICLLFTYFEKRQEVCSRID